VLVKYLCEFVDSPFLDILGASTLGFRNDVQKRSRGRVILHTRIVRVTTHVRESGLSVLEHRLGIGERDRGPGTGDKQDGMPYGAS